MTKYFSPKVAASPHGSVPKTAVLLLNLGTPDAPTTSAVRRYLAEFLSDSRVVERPRWFWLPILYGIILQIRPRRSAHAYRLVWSAQGSPLEVNTRELAAAVQEALDSSHKNLVVRHAMRYGRPAIGSVMRELATAGVTRFLVLPLFPQYSATTTAAAFDAVTEELRKWRRVPQLRWIDDYHDDPRHIDALARSVEVFRGQHGGDGYLLLSFHGLPQSYVRAGDPYFDQCHTTARLLTERLNLGEDRIGISFQSRLAGEPWLMPYTDKVLEELPAKGTKHVQVLCPGFAVDCLETLEEIALRNKETFIDAGGELFDYIPALNADPVHVAMVSAIVGENLWVRSRESGIGNRE